MAIKIEWEPTNIKIHSDQFGVCEQKWNSAHTQIIPLHPTRMTHSPLTFSSRLCDQTEKYIK